MPADLARAGARPRRAEAFPQQRVGHHAVAGAAQPRQRVLAGVEQRAEERAEEHHLGEDEPHHPQPERAVDLLVVVARTEEHTSELQSLMRNSYAVFCLKKKIQTNTQLVTNT